MEWERYTEQALKALLKAKEWALRLNAQQIFPEHLLLGLFEEAESVAFKLLEEIGVDVAEVREQLSSQIASEPKQRAEEPTMSASLRRILKRAVSEAQLLGDEHVDTSHLLLSLMKEKVSRAEKLLRRLGVRYEDLRRKIFRLKAEELGEAPSITLPETFVIDLTEKFFSGEIQPVKFWLTERETFKRTLLRHEENNPILIGNYETAWLLVHQFAYDLQFGSLPESLSGRRIIAIDWAGIWLQRREAEELLIELLKEIKRVEPQPILFAGALSELTKRSPMLLTAIFHGHIRAIAVSGQDEWDKFVKEFPSATFAFNPICVSEPNETEALEWLNAHKSFYEEFHRVEIEDDAISEAILIAKEKFKDKSLLAIAKSLIDEACAYARCQVLAPENLRNLEDEMEQLHSEMRRILRAGDKEHLSELMERAIALQTQIDTIRQKLHIATPKVSAKTVQSISP
ncbi:MAG: hypothetical protein NZ805_03635 [Armatimonadetes bacterium]|nr:hypothetical protein [Armatimonadota bacterium]MDW8029107.1 Clp protease N-terminal domain-containing protein [Armatimonadota bacterium]